MEVAPFFVDFHHFLSIFTIFYRFSRFTHFCRDLHFVAIYALFPQFFFGQNSLLRNITRFLHVCCQGEAPQALSADPGLLEMQLQGELNGRKEIKNNEHETHLKKPQLDLLHLMKQQLSLALDSVTGIIFSCRLISGTMLIVASLPECPASEGLYSSHLPHLSSPQLPPPCINHQISHLLPA